jgi:hypothetical protein
MTRDAKGRFVKRKRSSVPMVAQSAAAPTFRSSWQYFALLIAVAVAGHYAAPFVRRKGAAMTAKSVPGSGTTSPLTASTRSIFFESDQWRLESILYPPLARLPCTPRTYQKIY